MDWALSTAVLSHVHSCCVCVRAQEYLSASTQLADAQEELGQLREQLAQARAQQAPSPAVGIAGEGASAAAVAELEQRLCQVEAHAASQQQAAGEARAALERRCSELQGEVEAARAGVSLAQSALTEAEGRVAALQQAVTVAVAAAPPSASRARVGAVGTPLLGSVRREMGTVGTGGRGGQALREMEERLRGLEAEAAEAQADANRARADKVAAERSMSSRCVVGGCPGAATCSQRTRLGCVQHRLPALTC